MHHTSPWTAMMFMCAVTDMCVRTFHTHSGESDKVCRHEQRNTSEIEKKMVFMDFKFRFSKVYLKSKHTDNANLNNHFFAIKIYLYYYIKESHQISTYVCQALDEGPVYKSSNFLLSYSNDTSW